MFRIHNIPLVFFFAAACPSAFGLLLQRNEARVFSNIDASPIATNQDKCEDAGLSCREVVVNNMSFTCQFGGEKNGTKGDVLLIHGFPSLLGSLSGLQNFLARQEFRTMLCNKRGISKDASPEGIKNYAMENYVDDMFDTADAAGFKKFHLISRGIGALHAWFAAGSQRGRDRLLSFSPMEMPHPDVLSKALLGPGADLEQQKSLQYAVINAHPMSATVNGNFLHNWYHGQFTKQKAVSQYKRPEILQKALYQYHAVFHDGRVATPPLTYGDTFTDLKFNMLLGKNPMDYGFGQKQTKPLGVIKVPTTTICGGKNNVVLCHQPWAFNTKDYVNAPYKHVVLRKGDHGNLPCNGGCSPRLEADFQAAIMKHIFAAIAREKKIQHLKRKRKNAAATP